METTLRERTGISVADGEVLVRLSGLHASLRRHEQTHSGLLGQLREQRLVAKELEAVLRAEERRLAALRMDPASDSIALGLLEAAVQGAVDAHESALRRLERTTAASSPLVDHAADTLRTLELQASAAKQALSSSALRYYENLVRAKKLPFMARPRGEACGECNLRLPSALVSLVSSTSTLFSCPHCGRLLLAPLAPQASSK